MSEIKPLEFDWDIGLGLGFFFQKETDFPEFAIIIIGPFSITINRWQYWKRYFK